MHAHAASCMQQTQRSGAHIIRTREPLEIVLLSKMLHSEEGMNKIWHYVHKANYQNRNN